MICSARIVGARLAEALGQPVIIENRGGAGGNIGTEYVAKAKPDGYTLLIGSNGNNTINPALYPSLPFDPAHAFAAITKLATVPVVLVASPALPAANLGEVIQLAKSQTGKLAYASPGIGSTAHLTAALLASRAGIELLHVPYKGGGAAIGGVLTGDVPLAFVVVSTAQALAQAGRVRAIAVTSIARSSAMPDVPTVAESGLPGFDVASWYGLLAPAGTPPDIIARLHAETTRILQQPDVQQQFLTMGAAPVGQYARRVRCRNPRRSGALGGRGEGGRHPCGMSGRADAHGAVRRDRSSPGTHHDDQRAAGCDGHPVHRNGAHPAALSPLTVSRSACWRRAGRSPRKAATSARSSICPTARRRGNGFKRSPRRLTRYRRASCCRAMTRRSDCYRQSRSHRRTICRRRSACASPTWCGPRWCA